MGGQATSSCLTERPEPLVLLECLVSYDLFSVALIGARYLAAAHSGRICTAQVAHCESASVGEKLAIPTDGVLLDCGRIKHGVGCQGLREPRLLPSAADRSPPQGMSRTWPFVLVSLLGSLWVVLTASHHCPALQSRSLSLAFGQQVKGRGVFDWP